MTYASRTLVGLIVVWCLLAPLITGDEKPPMVIAPHCSDKCGSVSIPYPFGIEEGCYLPEKDSTSLPYYKIKCNHSTTPPKPIFGIDWEVLNISVDGDMRANTSIGYDCYNNENNSSNNYQQPWAEVGRFTLSGTKNVLVAMGCDTYVWFSGIWQGRDYRTGCMTRCEHLDDVPDGECIGIGCCHASFPEGAKNITTEINSFDNHSAVPFNPCSAAFPVAKDAFTFRRSYLAQDLKYYKDWLAVPVILNWAVGTENNCSAAQASDHFLCKDNTICEDPPHHQVGYRCKCKHGFTGNPYLPQGCVDLDECKESNNCTKPGYCINKIGGYDCKCPKGYNGNGTKTQPCIPKNKIGLIPAFVTAGVGSVIITLLVIGFLMQWKRRERKLIVMRERFFRQNGGLLLHEKLSRREVDTFKIYCTKDLENATNNYSNENVIGRGGFGIVYKGILPNHQVVAIKKSLKVDPNQVEQFINEVLVLSQIKNKYVVKLLGCCLESEVPLLVYEFINNGTLYEHLNNEVKAFNLGWHARLKIASQVANVLSYLHYSISTPIIHRDMKSMNILLDECYTAKVTDFGASRLVPPDQSQFATVVLGTRGYLDPEYLQTSELTEKSDVYSFGVVLLELLTRKKAVCNERPEVEKCLAMHFLIKLKRGDLLDILDKNIVSERTIEDIQYVANLAKWCLMLKGEERPTMKEVAMELEAIIKKGSHPWYYDGSSIQDHESLLAGVPRSDDGGYNSVIESNSYDSQLLSSLGSGR